MANQELTPKSVETIESIPLNSIQLDSITSDLNRPVVPEQYIPGFDIPMDLSVGVKILQPFEYFSKHCSDGRLIEDPVTTVL